MASPSTSRSSRGARARIVATLAVAWIAAGCVPVRALPSVEAGAESAPVTSVIAPPRPAPPEDHIIPAAPPGPPPLAVTAPFVELVVPSHAPAVVSVPMGATSPRPLLVATHGAGGTPEAHCSFWRAIVGDAAFVLCPRGVTSDVHAPPGERGYFYPTHHALEREVALAVAALRERFGPHVDPNRPIYAGFSQGATMGALFVARPPRPPEPDRRDPPPFAGAILIEGGFDEWTLASARAFKAASGERVVFACGRAKCVDGAKRSAGYLRKAGVETVVIHAEGAGHTYEGAVKGRVEEAFPWVIEGDARWLR